MKKQILLLLPLFIFAGLFFSREQLLTFGIEKGIKYFSQNIFGKPLQYESFERSETGWTVRAPSLSSLSQDPERKFFADEILFSPSWDWRSFRVKLNVELINARLNMGERPVNLKEVYYRLFQSSPLFRMDTSLSMENGKILWKEGEAAVALTGEIRRGEVTGDCAVRFSEDRNLRIRCFGGSLETKFHEIEINSLAQAAKWMGMPFHGWESQGGVLDGTLLIHLRKSRPEIVSNLIVKDMRFVHPDLEVEAELKQMQLFVQERVDLTPSHPALPSLTAKVQLDGESAIVLKEKGLPLWNVQGIKGEINYHPNDGFTLQLHGDGEYQDRAFDLSMKGGLRVEEEMQTSFDLGLRLQTAEDDVSTAKIVVRQLGEVCNCAQIEVRNFGEDEFAFLRTALIRASPKWKRVHMHGGTVDATGTAYLDGFSVTEIQIDQITASRLEFDFDSLGICMKVEKGEGDFSLNLAAGHPLDSLNAHFSIIDGELKLLGSQRRPWNFTGIHTELAIEKGIIQESVIRGEFEGLDGEMFLNWTAPEEVLQVHFQGITSKIQDLFPELIGQGLKRGFANDRLDVTASMKKLPNGGEVQGEIHLSPGDGETSHSIAFGFDLLQEKAENNGFIPDHPGSFPDYFLSLRNGWFDGHELPTSKFIAPFVFESEEMLLSGVGDFTGFFDQDSLAVEYDVRNLSLEGPHFLLKIEELNPAAATDEEALLPAAHYFNFAEGKRYGFIPVKEGFFHEKRSGLLFSDIQTLITFDDDRIHFRHLDTVCNGAYFEGEIGLDFTAWEQNRYSIDIQTHAMAGKLSQMQSMVEQTGYPLALENLSCEGDLALREKGGNLRFEVSEDEVVVTLEFAAELANGTIASDLSKTQLRGLGCKIDYNLQQDSLLVYDLQGTLLTQTQEEFLLGGNRIEVRSIPDRNVSFDLWLGDQTRDLIRVSGQTEEKEGLAQFQFNPEVTHIGNVHPENLKLSLRNWSDVAEFQLNLEFHLSSFFRDLQKFARMGIFDNHLNQKLQELSNASGAFQSNISYHEKDAQLLYSISGEEVVIGEHRFQKCLLNGKKKEQTWIIDQLQLDNSSFAADILHENSEWKLNFLGVRLGDAVLIGLDGIFSEKSNRFAGKLNLLEINLDQLQEWPQIYSLVQHYDPQGLIRASGEVKIDGNKEWQVDALVNLSLKNCLLQGIPFKDAENISCHFLSDQRVTFRRLKTTLQEDVELFVDAAHYSFAEEEFLIEGMHFNIPVQRLQWVSEQMKRNFPSIFGDGAAEVLTRLKSSGSVKGTLDFETYPPHTALKLTLQDDLYRFNNQEYDVKNFQFELDPFESRLTTLRKWEDRYIGMMVRSQSPELLYGDLYITDRYPSLEKIDDSNQTIACKWRLDSADLSKVQYETVQGTCCGLSADLAFDLADPDTLIGKVSIDAHKASEILPAQLREMIHTWQIGNSYVMNGRWKMDDIGLFFSGTLEGKGPLLKGYQFEQLQTHLEMNPHALYFTDFTLKDACGEIHTDHIEIEQKKDEQWILSMPHLTVSNFRPSLLHLPGNEYTFPKKPLLIRHMEINDLKGNLANASTLTGSGSLYFTNRSRKTLQNTIFAIPAEVLSRIGLDLSLLTPVTGTLIFDIKDQKMVFTKFKDVYSDKHLSKFNLSNGPYLSYVDFDGNLNVQIKMKQHNLVFKLAELFTVSIQGTLAKPTYSLQKHHSPTSADVAGRQKAS